VKHARTALLSFLFCTAVHASPVTYAFTGAVTDDPFGLSGLGATINGSFVFDASALDAIASPATGSYASTGPAYGFTVQISGQTYALGGALVVNTANDIGVDQYGVLAQDAAITLELFFQDATSSALMSDALPKSVPSVAAFDSRQFRLFSADAEFLGSIDTLSCTDGCSSAAVSEPTTVLLVVPALLTIGFARRIGSLRRRNSSGRLRAARCASDI
jgi:hypothetical protein